MTTLVEDERTQTMFAETAILMLHPDESRRALAKERVYAILYPADKALSTPEGPDR